MGKQGGKGWQEQALALEKLHPGGGIEAVASAQGEQTLTAQIGMQQRLVAGRRQQHRRAGQRCRGLAGGGGRCWGAWQHQVMAGDKKGKARSGQGNGHHLGITEGGVQGGGCRQGRRFRRFAGAHHSGQGEQHGIEALALELPHPVGGAPERQVQLHRPADPRQQQMGMEGINAKAQGLTGRQERGRQWRGLRDLRRGQERGRG